MVETRIAVGNSVFRELLNVISNSPLSAVGMASAASSNGQFMRLRLSSGTSAPGAALWMRQPVPASKTSGVLPVRLAVE
jgi:hypothetical protein